MRKREINRTRAFHSLMGFLQDTNITDELMFFTPDILSTISRLSPSNVHFTPGVMFLPIDAFKDLHPGLKQLYHQSIAAYDSTWSSPCMSKSASIKVGVHRSKGRVF